MSALPFILLVDDSPIVRAIVAHALGAEGMRVETVDDPRGIAGAVAKERPDLLLVDATFPGITDADLVTLVSQHASAIPVVLFSDRKNAELEELASQMNARGVVPKDGTALAGNLAPYLSRR